MGKNNKLSYSTARKIWDTCGGSVEAVAKRLTGKPGMNDPYAFAAKVADIVKGTTYWRTGPKPNPSVPNGIKKDEFGRAIELYKAFYGRYPEDVNFEKLKLSTVMMELGKAKYVGYEATKHEDIDQLFNHPFSEGDMMYFDPRNKLIIIKGPSLRVTERGIED